MYKITHSVAVFIFSVIVLLVFCPARAGSPSFDCAKASQALEGLICGSPILSDLDAKMAVSFQNALSTAKDDRNVFLDAQRHWLRERTKICQINKKSLSENERKSAENCLLDVYKDRINVLSDAKKFLYDSLYGSNSIYGIDGDIAEAAKMGRELEGNYEYKEPVAVDRGGTVEEESNILTFITTSPNTAYAKLDLALDYGRSCHVSGILNYKKVGGFVLDDQDDDESNEENCLLSVSLSGKKLQVNTAGYCEKYCGFQGSIGFKALTTDQKTPPSMRDKEEAAREYLGYKEKRSMKCITEEEQDGESVRTCYLPIEAP